MANRFPLIFNSGAGQIQELAASDNLDLTSSNLVNAGILSTSSGSVTAPSLQIGSGTTYNPGLYSPGTDQLAVATNGVERVEFGTAEVVFNDGGTDYDFRVEGDTNANLLFVDASTDRVGVGTNSPATTLDVNGALQVTGTVSGYIAGEIRLGSSASGGQSAISTQATGAAVMYFHHRGTGNTGNFQWANGTGASTTLMFLDSSGRLLVGTASASGANLLQVNSDALVNGLTVGRGLASISSNTAVGSGALAANTTGSDDTACGVNALYSNTTGGSNTAFGSNPLRYNTTGGGNTAFGLQTLFNTTTGGNNTACGVNALYANTTASYNVAIGQEALRFNTTGGNNTANGFQALYSNTTASHNTANGHKALFSNTTGTYGTAGGYNALYTNTTGDGNTALGYEALYFNTTGTNNTSIGFQTSANTNPNTTGSNNTFLGYTATGASATASNVITLGNNSIATLRCQVTTITALSDARDKTNITNIPAGLDFINALRPVAFDWNMRDGAKVGIHEFGFIAQELQEAQASTGITVPNLVSTENPDKLEASAGTLLPVLVNAVQELTAMVRDLQAELSILKGA